MPFSASSKTALLALLPMLVLCSCQDDEAQQKIARLEADMVAQKELLLKQTADEGEFHKKLVEGLTTRDKQVSDRITFIAKEVFKEYQEKFTPVDPTGQGFSTVASNNGNLLISCKGAEPYLDGHKLILNIGNPYYMTYTGFALKVRFGTRQPDYPANGSQEQIAEWQKSNEEWQNTLVEKELSFTDELAAGAWSKVELILTPSKPEQVAYVALSMKTNQVSLRKPKE